MSFSASTPSHSHNSYAETGPACDRAPVPRLPRYESCDTPTASCIQPRERRCLATFAGPRPNLPYVSSRQHRRLDELQLLPHDSLLFPGHAPVRQVSAMSWHLTTPRTCTSTSSNPGTTTSTSTSTSFDRGALLRQECLGRQAAQAGVENLERMRCACTR